MKILHTSDLHLTAGAPERWQALDELVAVARREQVSALVISGDLFDANIDAETLRDRLRAALKDSGFQTIILPGNHDCASYRGGLYFGPEVKVIDDWRQPVRLGPAVIWGLPFEKIGGEKLVGRLRDLGALMNDKEENHLLFHGELLDAYFSRRDLGDEGEQRYMPVHLSYFEPLPVRSVLAGHFHSRYDGWRLPGGGLFIYPGSPVAVTRRESGRRRANLVAPGREPREIALDSFHYENLRLVLDPFSAAHPLALLAEELSGLHPQAGLHLTVEGLYNGSALGLDESALAAGIRELSAGRLAAEPVENYFDVRHVLEDDLFKQFMARLDETGSSPELKKRAAELAIMAFRTVKACS